MREWVGGIGGLRFAVLITMRISERADEGPG